MRNYYSYHLFDDDLHEDVARAAHDQDALIFEELADRYRLDDTVRVTDCDGRPVQSVTFTPEVDYDETHARVYHVPFAISLDPNTLMRLMRQFASDPSEQLIAYSNPGTVGQTGGTLKLSDIRHIVRTHDMTPAIAPQQADLANRKLASVDRLGYSFGTLQALTAMGEHAPHPEVETQAGILVEPVAVAKQNIFKLAGSFLSSGAEVARYIDQTDSAPYSLVRNQRFYGLDIGLVNYSIGIGRATNLAAALQIAHGGIYDHAHEVLTRNQADSLTFAWGTASEISEPETTAQQVATLQEQFGDAVHEMPLQGMHHAGGDDINLHALIMNQALRDARKHG